MLINRNFTRLWIAQATSAFGDFVFNTALLLWIATKLMAGSPYAPAVSTSVLIAVSITIIIVGPPAGAIVERHNKRAIMLRADGIRAGLLAALAIIAYNIHSTDNVVLLALGAMCVIANTVTAQFFGPARFVLVRDIVPDTHFGRASSYSQLSAAIAAILGPAAAAALVGLFGISAALAVNCLTYLVSYIAIHQVVDPNKQHAAEEKPPIISEFISGLRWMAGNSLLRSIAVLVALSTLGIGALNALEVYFVETNLSAPAETLGIIMAGFGAGAIGGGLAGGILGDKHGQAVYVKSSMLTFAILFIIYSRVESVPAAIAINVVFGIAVGILNATIFPLMQHAVPREYLARVGAVFNPLMSVASLVALSLAGTLVSTVLLGLDTTIAGFRFRPIDTVFFGGGLICLAAAIYGYHAIKQPKHPATETPTEETLSA